MGQYDVFGGNRVTTRTTSNTSAAPSPQGANREQPPLHSYRVPGDGLAFGASLGNAHGWLTMHGNGSIQQLFSRDIAAMVANTVVVRYAPAGPDDGRDGGVTAGRLDDGALLRPVEPGTMDLHPAYQRHTFTLPPDLHVDETVFLPLATGDDPCVAYYQVSVVNAGATPRALRVFAFGRLCGALGADMVARHDGALDALVAHNQGRPDAVRVFGCVGAAPLAAHETSRDFGRVYDILHARDLSGDTSVEGDIVAALQINLDLRPGERRDIAFVLAFSAHGEDDAAAVYRAARDAGAPLDDTIAYVAEATALSQVLTPDPVINQGALWSKVNMLRVMARYPQGPAFTNEPGVSHNVVARDAAWFVYGSDHFRQDFSRALLDTLARLQYPDGKIPEYYSALDGTVEDYGLNINDNTPLFILAVNHHYRAAGDDAWLRATYPAVAKAAHYILAQRDERGLVSCTADDERGNVWAIASWRNIIPGYHLNGAVTEINAECAAALRAAGHLAGNAGRPAEEARALLDAGDTLRETMNELLLNPENGLYYLNIDTDGAIHTDVTGDQVFPVMFRVCDDETGFRIISRLNYPDFWTPAGLRTASSGDLRYDPAANVGLIGGVWPGLSWWYAFAAARYHPEVMVKALATSFAHYAADPRRNNTVPGQFSEWFDGESFVNRGMRLSPWEPPRFLWAAVEGVCGVVLQPGHPRVNPLIPATWRWVALRRLPYHDVEISFFAAREQGGTDALRLRLYATTRVVTDDPLEVYDEDVTDLARALNPDVALVALRRPGETAVFVGNTASDTALVQVELSALLRRDATYEVRVYNSERYAWSEGVERQGKDIGASPLMVQGGGFCILRFVDA